MPKWIPTVSLDEVACGCGSRAPCTPREHNNLSRSILTHSLVNVAKKKMTLSPERNTMNISYEVLPTVKPPVRYRAGHNLNGMRVKRKLGISLNLIVQWWSMMVQTRLINWLISWLKMFYDCWCWPTGHYGSGWWWWVTPHTTLVAGRVVQLAQGKQPPTITDGNDTIVNHQFTIEQPLTVANRYWPLSSPWWPIMNKHWFVNQPQPPTIINQQLLTVAKHHQPLLDNHHD